MNPVWTDPKSGISKHFTVGESLYLPKWHCYHEPTEEEKANILTLAAIADEVRDIVGKPFVVHCWIRPTQARVQGPYNGKNYNVLVGGARQSAHITGRAIDFHVEDVPCGEVRKLLVPELGRLKLRMEDMDGNWVHLDNKAPFPGQSRFFKP
jgi:hypothetical protein